MNAGIFVFILSYIIYNYMFDVKPLIIYACLIIIYTVLTQFIYFKTPYNTMRNKTTVASWQAPSDPHIYGKVKLNVVMIEDFLKKKSKEYNKKITYTLYAIKLISLVIRKVPAFNTYIKYGIIKNREAVDLCCLVTIGDSDDLANAVIKKCDIKSILDISNELDNSVKTYRNKKDNDHNQKNKIYSSIPNFILGVMVQILSYISSIGIGFKPIGVRLIIYTIYYGILTI